jgi:hypothetical protein
MKFANFLWSDYEGVETETGHFAVDHIFSNITLNWTENNAIKELDLLFDQLGPWRCALES